MFQFKSVSAKVYFGITRVSGEQFPMTGPRKLASTTKRLKKDLLRIGLWIIVFFNISLGFSIVCSRTQRTMHLTDSDLIDL